MEYRRLRAAMLGTSILVATAVAASSAPANDQVVITMTTQPPSPDAMISTASVANELMRAVCEPLLTLDLDQKLHPGLAERWEISADGKEAIFHLRKNVKFHDGSPLTASEAAASLARWSRLSLPGKFDFAKAEWVAVDDHTLKLVQPEPSYRTLYSLANSYNQIAVVVKGAEDAGDKPMRELNCTGPYKLTEWVADQYITLEPNPDYLAYGGNASGWAGDRTPKNGGIRYEIVSDDATRLMGLKTGIYDVIRAAYDSVEELRETEEIKLHSYPYVAQYIVFNKAHGIFKDTRARKAVDIGIDRDEIMFAAVGIEDLYAINHQAMMRHQAGIWDSKEGLEGFGIPRPDEAKALMQQAGYDGREIVLLTSRDYSEQYNASVAFQQQMAQIGVKVRLDIYDFATFLAKRSEREAWDAYLISNTLKSDPTQWPHFSPKAVGWTSDPELDEILEKFRQAVTLEDAMAPYDQLMNWNYRYYPATKIGENDTVMATGSRVADMGVDGGPIYWSIELKN